MPQADQLRIAEGGRAAAEARAAKLETELGHWVWTSIPKIKHACNNLSTYLCLSIFPPIPRCYLIFPVWDEHHFFYWHTWVFFLPSFSAAD